MRRSGADLPCETCMNPLLRPSRTCSAEATPIHFLLMACPEKSACDSHQDRHKGIAEIPSRRSFSKRSPGGPSQRIGSVKKHRLYRGTGSSNPSPSRRESRANLKTTLLGRGIAGLESPAPAGITEILRILSPKAVGVREDHQSGSRRGSGAHLLGRARREGRLLGGKG